LKKNICVCLLVFIGSFLSKIYAAPPEDSLGPCRVSKVYQEAAWISMDLPTEKQQEIDQIFIEKNIEVQRIIHDPALFVIYPLPGGNFKGTQNDESLYLFRVSQKLEDIRNDTQHEILKLLTREQQVIFNTMITERKTNIANFIEVMGGLNLDSTQQSKVMQLLSQCQEEIWRIISNPFFSWEARKRRIDRITLFNRVMETLKPEQQAVLNEKMKGMEKE